MCSLRCAVCVCAIACGLVLAGSEARFAFGQPKEKALEPYINPATKKDKAEEQLAKLDARVKRDKSQPDNPVVEIRIFNQNVTDDDLKELTPFTKLRKLEFSGEKITGTGFAALTELPLEELHVMFAKGINDAGLKEIAKLKNLKVLVLPQGKFTDAGAKVLASLTNLEEFGVSFGVEDETFAGVLKGMKKLRKLDVSNSRIGDESMKVASEFPEIRILHLYGSAVTDAGYASIGKMAKLEEIRTSYKITDKGLAELGGLKNLKKLNVWNSDVTMKAVRALPNLKNLKEIDVGTWNIKKDEAAKLREELPNCKVIHEK
jgi:hypothetical protein